jgi:hypothetical protein
MDTIIGPQTKYKLKSFFWRSLKVQIENCGICPNCNKPNTGYAWCKFCDPGRLLKISSSGNSEIDNIIIERQRLTKHYHDNLEWIPYDRFQDFNPIGEGGFATIISAIWLDGAPKFDKHKSRTGRIKVALKRLKNSENMIEALVNEVMFFREFHYNLR